VEFVFFLYSSSIFQKSLTLK